MLPTISRILGQECIDPRPISYPSLLLRETSPILRNLYCYPIMLPLPIPFLFIYLFITKIQGTISIKGQIESIKCVVNNRRCSVIDN